MRDYFADERRFAPYDQYADDERYAPRYDDPPEDEPRSRGWSRRGFASMDETRRREISRRGGEASHASGHAHEWDSEEARAAGRLGGRARWGAVRRERLPAPPEEARERERELARAEDRAFWDEEERYARRPSREREEEEDERAERSGRSRRGFASMDHERLRQIASRGGRAAHESGHAHEWSSGEARAAGRLGGRARWG